MANLYNISSTHTEKRVVRSKESHPPNISSKNAVMKRDERWFAYVFISSVSVVISLGSRKALITCFINLVKAPGAGPQPKGRPIHW